MEVTLSAAPVSMTRLWVGRILSGLVVAFLVFDGIMKVLQLAPAKETTTQLGYPEHLVLWLGILECACLVLYVLPRTSVLGAVMLTGFLGGAVATHVRFGSPAFSVAFPFIIGAFIWGGLYLREARLASLLPLRK